MDVFCRKCGHKFENEADLFCRGCGTKRAEESVKTKPAEVPEQEPAAVPAELNGAPQGQSESAPAEDSAVEKTPGSAAEAPQSRAERQHPGNWRVWLSVLVILIWALVSGHSMAENACYGLVAGFLLIWDAMKVNDYLEPDGVSCLWVFVCFPVYLWKRATRMKDSRLYSIIFVLLLFLGIHLQSEETINLVRGSTFRTNTQTNGEVFKRLFPSGARWSTGRSASGEEIVKFTGTGTAGAVEVYFELLKEEKMYRLSNVVLNGQMLNNFGMMQFIGLITQ